jgi:hypothetical protein
MSKCAERHLIDHLGYRFVDPKLKQHHIFGGGLFFHLCLHSRRLEEDPWPMKYVLKLPDRPVIYSVATDLY